MEKFLMDLIYTDTDRFIFLSQCQFHIESPTEQGVDGINVKKVDLTKIQPKFLKIGTSVKIIRVVKSEKNFLKVDDIVKISAHDDYGFPLVQTLSGSVRIYPDAFAATSNAYHNSLLKKQLKIGVLDEVIPI